ncbi:1-hydroxycarotenoid 3,4-desaturase CrtD [Nevskia ramosa]|uniref:1-hydroxycarotenoid 3,4-desaturase CrtD n=1 Tax=Nevskia ramosa TaxID=64002 RepID=UPI002356FA57|nr:1-hydroxycarotenoid 3,4-desaturase CrtD [Nevskia ramosa]
MRKRSVLIVGAGIGGLSAAIDLAAQGCSVTVLERASTVGGKMRTVAIEGQQIDSGPTVLTMRWVFDALFASAGLDFAAAVPLDAASVLARHAWDESARLDLHANLGRSADAIGDFAGAAEAQRFIAFSERARAIYRTLEGPFIRKACSGPMALSRAVGLHRLRELWQIAPFTTLWRALGDHFHDPRLRQLFGRYATYCGSSPFRSPATLMLVAHVEQDGVWRVRGGMHRLAQAMAAAATGLGAQIRQDCEVSEILDDGQRATGLRLASGECLYADAVIANADPSAVAAGLFGERARHAVRPLKPAARSLSAVTWSMLARSSGFPLSRHNVFFSGDYRAEFDDLRRARLPREPTVYVCAQDRGDGFDEQVPDRERLLCLINAPATGDRSPFDASDIASCTSATFKRLERCGLSLQQQPEQTVLTTPQDFHRLFPGTGGALYGPASHGWMASFQRPGSRSRMPGLYLAGGSTHPGPGVPMAAISGRLAAASLLADFASTQPWFPGAIAGGISMDSATTANTPSP